MRLLADSNGKSLKSVLPGTAAVVSGWKDLPGAGDEVLSGSESDVKRALANRVRKAAEDALVEDAEAINESRREERERREAEEASSSAADSTPPLGAAAEPAQKEQDAKKELRIVLKGDVSGSVEAVEGALQGIGNQRAGVKIVATGVGDVSESDVLRAKAVDGKRPSSFASLAGFWRNHGPDRVFTKLHSAQASSSRSRSTSRAPLRRSRSARACRR